ncbi:hypothetical protein [uncultured Metabacillus sp.]|uniref:hypothetical protein n=1 Tax=uncultured Metabacillus sp. TaxID=2860135 RepID=UPI00260A2A24|nr:hypothetical protein [uncultured Metabacillus sp.]
MGELEIAIEQLKSEGFKSEDIKKALNLITKETIMQKATTKSLDELLDGLTEDNHHEEQISDVQGEELI